MNLRLCLTMLCAVAALARASADTPVARISVGPNMLVSRDGNVPHVELMVAANPKDARNLLGAAITATRREGGWACRTYASRDGGATWIESSFSEQTELGSGDPQVAFSSRGTGLFAALVFVRDPTGRQRAGLHVYRSEDGGFTWQPPADLGYSYDHEQIVVDHSVGKFAGRIYIAALYGYPVYTIGVFRSEDDGRSFTGPVAVADGAGKLGVNVSNIQLFRDGTLFVPYVDFPFKPEERPKTGPVQTHMFFSTSSDGGVTFSASRPIHTQTAIVDDPYMREFGMPIFALDASGGPYTDRIYVAWTEFRKHGEGPRLYFSSSADRGLHWTAPRPLDPAATAGTRQFQPALTVNKDGVLGITWFDARHEKGTRGYDQYFTASLDGGETFLPPVRVSSETSVPLGAGNMVPSPSTYTSKGITRLSLLTSATRWGSGGDYMGLTSELDGTFRPFWADSRSGTFHIYTAAVTVERAPAPTPAAPTPAAPTPAGASSGPPRPKVEADLTDKVAFVFDPLTYDMATSEVVMPVRIKNSTRNPIFAPLRVDVVGFGLGDEADYKEFAPEILNAANGKTGAGALFDFSPALGTRQRLEPGEVSGPIVWRLKLVEPLKTPDVQLRLTAHVEQ